MDDLKTAFPVNSPDNRLKVPAGTVINESLMSDLLVRGQGASSPLQQVLRHGTIRSDMESFISMPPYWMIFSDSELMEELFGVMDLVVLPAPVFGILDYFRGNDFYTYRHMLMIFMLTALLSRDLITDREERIHKLAAGPTHDIGKVTVPLGILKKTTPLTVHELDYLRHHAAAGYILLSHYFGDASHFSALVARDHHERLDGSGYPRGAQQDDPLIEIVSVCDMYDALISPRPYRPLSFNNRTALENLTLLAEERKIGWDVVHSLVVHNRRMETRSKKIALSTEKRGVPPPGNSYGITVDDDTEPADDPSEH